MNRHVVIVLLLLAATLAVFAQVRGFPFINYDDIDYITQNETVMGGLSGEGMRWAMTASVSATWQPLTWLSFMADIRDGKADPAVFHTTNLVLHVLNVLLLYFLFVALTGEAWPSALVAALFAVHPLHVESVAWVAERKDVLSTFWGFSALILWTLHVRSGRRRELVASLACFALGLMAKPMLVTWPFIMLLLDAWPLDRWGRKPLSFLVREKAPFFVLAIVSSVITYAVQAGEGAVARTDVVGLGARVANAIDSYAAYLGQTFWPHGFSILYPHPNLIGGEPLAAGRIALAFGVLAALSAVVWFLRARRYTVVGWLLFLGALFPVIGLVQIGVHARADRFTYVPLVGIFAIVAWALRDVSRRLAARGALRFAAPALGVLMVAGCALAAHAQTALWRDQIDLYEASLKAAPPGSPRIRYNLAVAKSQAGRHEEAVALYREVLAVDPDHTKAWNNLGRTLDVMQKAQESEAAFQEALRRQPAFALARINYATMLDRTGRRAEAIDQRLRALADEPDNAANHNVVGSLLAMSGRVSEAVVHFQRATQLEPGNREYAGNLDRARRLAAAPPPVKP
jgi:cytochrome c-type biogenesis protein CcmH/NrfG